VLRAVVQAYLKTGEPVPSRVALKGAGLDVSSATVRVVMAQLAEAGYVSQPHASAGRVPTLAGMRVYVEQLMRTRRPSAAQRDDLVAALRGAGEEPASLVRVASRHLAAACEVAAVARRPNADASTVQRLELLPLGAGRVVAILVLEDEVVRHRVVGLNAQPDELARAQSLFNERYAGRPLGHVRRMLREELAQADTRRGRLLRMAETALPDDESADDAVIVEGRRHLIRLHGVEPAVDLTEVIEALEDKRQLLDLLEVLADAQGPHVIFGEETTLACLHTFTLVGATYGVGGRAMGTVAVLGPRRMNYGRIVPWVGYTAQAISGMLRASRGPRGGTGRRVSQHRMEHS
jgi:heat-inducible transcriptional repressor